MFLHPLVLFQGRGFDHGLVLRAVVADAVRRGRAHRSPHFATCHAQRYGATGQQCENDRLNDFVQLLVCHNDWIFRYRLERMSLARGAGS